MRHPPTSRHRWMLLGAALRWALLGSLSRRLRWSYALVSVLPLALLGLVLIGFSLHARREQVTQEQQTTANWVAREIQASLSAVDEQLLQFGQQVKPGRSSTELLDAITALRATMPDVSDVAVLDHTGKERIHVSQLRGHFGSELIDRSADPLVQWTLQSGRVAQGPIIRERDGILFYPSYAPIFNDSGTVIGVIRVEVRIDRIARTLRSKPLAEGNIVYLVDSTGNILFATDDEAPSIAPPALSWLLGGRAASAEYTNGAGTPVIGAWSPLLVQPDRWWVVVELPRSQAYAPIWRDGLLLVSAMALVIITAIGWGLYQTRVVLRPLAELRAGAATIGRGDLAARIPRNDIAEIGALAEEFNRMAEHLQASRARIEQQNERLREGLTLAREIQLGLLPSAPPRAMPPLALRAYSAPAYEVGGDFYTFIMLDERRLGIAIGDISGKGVGAALMMALALSTIEGQRQALEQPAQLLRAVNLQLSRRLMENQMNAALLYVILDMDQGTLTMANAGMIPPYLLRDGQARMLEVRGFLLGPMPELEYEVRTIDLLPDDLLLLVSDGIIEARRPNGELFSFKRVSRFLEEHGANMSPDDLIAALLDHVTRFVDGAEQHDDMTIIVLQPNLSPLTVGRRSGHAREVTV